MTTTPTTRHQRQCNDNNINLSNAICMWYQSGHQAPNGAYHVRMTKLCENDRNDYGPLD
ncbi:hypothetical protein MTR_8g463710 [Medicago truncatula]|uniref:Uncharacterized protein n=1 Tax=Medicago truncatula TaxID=3880 RepID=A0A072TPV4_MEDTR|nr:hypothetical protein MTR_8g463710 [Medicago truncatula]